MKKLMYFGAVLILGLVTLIGVTSQAATYRLGGDSVGFNYAVSTTKTAAYTVTTSDDLVNVTCSSANITITLPTVLSARATGTKAFKILKTDATVYSVIVTPATGDTIGGESTRYLTKQNDYIVISTGPGNDWAVDFESPLVAEDYEAGTVTVPSITVNNGVAASGAISGTTGTFTGLVTGTGTGDNTFGNQTTVTIGSDGDVTAGKDLISTRDVIARTGTGVFDNITSKAGVFSGAVSGTTITGTGDISTSAGHVVARAGAGVFDNMSVITTFTFGGNSFTVMTTTINGTTRNLLYY